MSVEANIRKGVGPASTVSDDQLVVLRRTHPTTWVNILSGLSGKVPGPWSGVLAQAKSVGSVALPSSPWWRLSRALVTEASSPASEDELSWDVSEDPLRSRSLMIFEGDLSVAAGL